MEWKTPTTNPAQVVTNMSPVWQGRLHRLGRAIISSYILQSPRDTVVTPRDTVVTPRDTVVKPRDTVVTPRRKAPNKPEK